jgi:hypothetical protein
MRRAIRLAVFAVAIFSISVANIATARADDRSAAIPGYSAVLRSFNAKLSPNQARDMAEHVLLLSSYYALDPRLLVAIVAAESGWREHAVSPAGAEGLGQLMPSTANGLSVLAFEKYENLDGTARYLRRLLNRFASLPEQTRLERALAGYNAGPEAVARYGGIPPYAETQTYVVRVIALRNQIGSMLAAMPKLAELPRAPVASRTVAPVAVPQPVLDDSVADFTALDTAAMAIPDPPAPVVKKPAVVSYVPKMPTAPISSKRISAGPISSIALSAPAFVADGDPIPVSLRVRGSGTIVLTAKVGPMTIERRAVSSSMLHVLLRPLPPASRTRVVTLQATAPGVRSRETMVAAVSAPTRSAFVSP